MLQENIWQSDNVLILIFLVNLYIIDYNLSNICSSLISEERIKINI